MNSLIQQKSGLLGSLDAIDELSKKTKARLLVISDSHGNSSLFEDIIMAFGRDCDALVFCGDGIYDLVATLKKATSDNLLMECLPPVIAFIRGNGDISSFSLDLNDFSHIDITPGDSKIIVPEQQLFTVASRTVLAVHGHRHNVHFGTGTLATSAYSFDADLIFYGHTHIAAWEDTDGSLILNPGSCFRPRGGLPPSLAVVSVPGETSRFGVEFFQVKQGHLGSYTFEHLSLASSSSFNW